MQPPAAAGSRSHARRSDSLLPREHGVYAEVGFPLSTALMLENLTTTGVLLTIAIVAAFLLHEPMIVLLGRRGRRTKTRLKQHAKERAAILGTVASVCGAVGLWTAGDETRMSIVALLPGLVGIAILVAVKRERTLFGESFIALILAYVSVPVGLSCGVPVSVILISATVWAAAFLIGTTTVHAILARSKRGNMVVAVLVAVIALLWMVSATVAVALGQPWWAFAVAPTALVSVSVIFLNISPKRLRVVGWALVLANVATMVILISADTTAQKGFLMTAKWVLSQEQSLAIELRAIDTSFASNHSLACE